MDTAARYVIRRPLTRELDDLQSPVRRFFEERFAAGLRDVQGRYRQALPPRAVPSGSANPGTVGTAADWLLRFLACPEPDLELAVAGAVLCEREAMHLLPALTGIAESLAVPLPKAPASPRRFTGPVPGSSAEPELLARSCWALALLTEAFRAGPAIAAAGPLGQFQHRMPRPEELLALASADALGQLAAFRKIFEAVLLPRLASRIGPWVLGPTFTGSRLMNADADLIAAGLLADLKTSVKPSLVRKDLFQVIGYALLDFDDDYQIDTLAIFAARYSHFAAWDIQGLLDELAGQRLDLPAVRAEFRQLLLDHQPEPSPQARFSIP